MTTLGRSTAVALTVAVLVTALAGCTSDRSVQAYCATVTAHKARYEQQMGGASGVAGLITSVAAVGDLRTMWTDLADHAPDDIRTDTEAVRDAWKKAADDANERKYVAAAAVALENANALQRVNAYIATNCGVDAAPLGTGAARRSPTAAPTTATVDGVVQLPTDPSGDDQGWDAVGDLLVRHSTIGDPGVVPDGSDAYLLDGAGEQQLNAATLLPGKTVTEARWTTARTASGPVLIAVAQVRHPAEGLNPETFTIELDALDWSDLKVLHSTTLGSYDSQNDGLGTVDGSGSSAVAVEMSTSTTTKVVGVDPMTGTTLWKKKGQLVKESMDTAVIQSNGPGLDGNGQAKCSVYTGVDIAKGTKVFSVAENDTTYHGACVELSTELVAQSFTATTALKALVRFTNTYDGQRVVSSSFDLRTGAPLHPKGNIQAFDPITGLEWRDDDVNLSGPTHDAAVIDTVTGAKVFSISEDHFEALKLQEDALYDGLLYTSTTDGTPVVKADGGSPVAQNASAYPVAPIAGSTLWSDGVVTRGLTRTNVLSDNAPTPTATP